MRRRIKLIYDDDCPNVDETRREIEAALRAEGLPSSWSEKRRDGGSHAERYPGSPTVLVDGLDVAPESPSSRTPGGPSCRVYHDESGLRGAPPREAIREALRGTADRSGVRGLAASAAGVASTGAALASGAAAACCAGPVVAPLLVATLGAGGAAWAAGLKPYSGWLLAFGAAMLAAGFWVTRRDRRCGAPPRRRDRVVRVALWTAAAIWIVGAFLNLATA